jgi:nucleoside-diphosphate-sugar epimerase
MFARPARCAKLPGMSRSGYDAVLLVTGFPAPHARRMVRHILAAEPHALVYAVVPADRAARAQAEKDALERADAERLVFLEGSPSAMDLGLSGAEFRRVTREVDRIHHMAHVSLGSVDKRRAFAENALSAAEIVETARASSSLQCLVFHSTTHVFGDRTGLVYEDDVPAGQSFRSEVEETRARAEGIARRAMRDVPVAIVRPTTIVGDFEPGDDDKLDGLYLLVLLIVAAPADIAIPFPGKGDTPLHIVPLDFVVEAAHAIGRARGVAGRTFHLADPHPLSARRVADLIAHAGGKRTAKSHIPSNLAKALLRTPGIERFVRSPRAFVEQLSTPVRYDTRNADLTLHGAVSCPPFEAYVGDLVGAVQEHLKLKQKRREVRPADAEVDDPLS